MSRRIAALAFAITAIMGFAATVQADTVETVVVTAEKRNRYGGDDDEADRTKVPYVAFIKRADHVFAQVRVTCDTRESDQRDKELKTTLRNMIKAAASTPTISLGVRQGNILVELKESNFDDLIGSDSRVDTSRALVEVKSAVSASDTLDDVTGRIKAFVNKTPTAGRTEILLEDSFNLTIVGPEQYRDPLLALIVTNARHTAEAFGSAHTMAVEGMENPIAWYQKGPLDLALYIPYRLTIEPAPRS
jgi:hypothetical protein